MSYAISTLGSDIPCKQQHSDWEAEKKRVEALAAKLGTEAEQCVRAKADYEAARAQNAGDMLRRQQCSQQHQAWSAASSDFVKNTVCKRFLAAKAKYAALVDSIKKSNQDLQMRYSAAMRSYDSALAKWTQQKQAHDAYAGYMRGMASGYAQSWGMTQNRYPVLKDITIDYRSKVCGQPIKCMPQSVKDSLVNRCTVVKGLGELKVEPICLLRKYMPTCPASPNCPTPVSSPGPKPTPPTKPALREIPIWAAWLRQEAGLGPGLEGCDPNKYPDPGPKPSCNPQARPTPVPPRPTCSVPNIPEVPPAPTCKPGFFEQVGPMWLLLAAGGAGLYWFAKKK